MADDLQATENDMFTSFNALSIIENDDFNWSKIILNLDSSFVQLSQWLEVDGNEKLKNSSGLSLDPFTDLISKVVKLDLIKVPNSVTFAISRLFHLIAVNVTKTYCHSLLKQGIVLQVILILQKILESPRNESIIPLLQSLTVLSQHEKQISVMARFHNIVLPTFHYLQKSHKQREWTYAFTAISALISFISNETNWKLAVDGNKEFLEFFDECIVLLSNNWDQMSNEQLNYLLATLRIFHLARKFHFNIVSESVKVETLIKAYKRAKSDGAHQDQTLPLLKAIHQIMGLRTQEFLDSDGIQFLQSICDEKDPLHLNLLFKCIQIVYKQFPLFDNWEALPRLTNGSEKVLQDVDPTEWFQELQNLTYFSTIEEMNQNSAIEKLPFNISPLPEEMFDRGGDSLDQIAVIDPEKHQYNFQDAARDIKRLLDNDRGVLVYDRNDKSVQTNESLEFDSRFESGNLLSARKMNDSEYELLLQPDHGCRPGKHHQWFFFKVSRLQVGRKYQFRILNVIKPGSSFRQGMLPCVYRSSCGWQRARHCDIRWVPNVHVNGTDEGTGAFYSLEMTNIWRTLEKDDDHIYLAYHWPYSYSQLQTDLLAMDQRAIAQRNDIYYSRQCLTRTALGLRCDLITLTSRNDEVPITDREYVFITSRVHPGETNSSHVMQGILLALLDENNNELRPWLKRTIVKIVPMLNPDGVSSHRCCTNGFDLNRCWTDPDLQLQPTIRATLRCILHAKQTLMRPLNIVLDLHGHSRHNDAFFYMCPTPPPHEYDAQRFCRYFATLPSSPISFEGCRINNPLAKKDTARCVLHAAGILCTATIEHTYNIVNGLDSDRQVTVGLWYKAASILTLGLSQFMSDMVTKGSLSSLVEVDESMCLCIARSDSTLSQYRDDLDNATPLTTSTKTSRQSSTNRLGIPSRAISTERDKTTAQ